MGARNRNYPGYKQHEWFDYNSLTN